MEIVFTAFSLKYDEILYYIPDNFIFPAIVDENEDQNFGNENDVSKIAGYQFLPFIVLLAMMLIEVIT